jgi:hypothetical protein
MLLFLACLVGCAPGNPQGRMPIEGTVRLNDKPIVSGSISFDSVSETSDKISSGAVIRDGKFSIPQEQGLAAGDYTVRLYSSEDTGQIDKNTGAALFKEQFPPKYNTASQEKISVSKGNTVFDFNLVATDADFR